MTKYAVATFDFFYGEVIEKIAKQLTYEEAKELAEKHAMNWTEDEGLKYWTTEADTGEILCVCSPLSDYGAIVVPMRKKINITP